MVLTGLELTALEPKISLPPPSHAGIISIVSAPSTWLPGRSLDFFFFQCWGPKAHMLDKLSTTEPQRISTFSWSAHSHCQNVFGSISHLIKVQAGLYICGPSPDLTASGLLSDRY